MDNHHEDEDNGSTRAALQNPLILQSIFSNLDFYDIKVVRRVCKAWEVEGSTILGKQCRLYLHQLFNDYEGYQREPTAVNPKFLQTIYIRSSENLLNKKRVIFPANVATLCFNKFASIWHHVVQEIMMDLDMDIAFGLPATLSALGFPNLRRMKISSTRGIDTSSPNLQFLPIHSLKEIEIEGSFQSGNPLLQNLINSAPNVEVLQVFNFYPNLASSRKLKVLKLNGNLGRIERNGAIVNADKVFRMVKQVGDHLEHLQVGQDFRTEFGRIPKFKQRFPRLPRLKSLTLTNFDLLNVVEQICPELLPRLEIVKFQDSEKLLDTSTVEEGRYLTHDGVSALELLDMRGPDPTMVATKRFPKVKRLVIEIGEPEEMDDEVDDEIEEVDENVDDEVEDEIDEVDENVDDEVEDEVDEEVGEKMEEGVDGNEDDEVNDEVVVGFPRTPCLATILKACSTWELLYLDIRIQAYEFFQLKFSQLLPGLKSLNVLKGIKQVKILSEAFLDDDDQDYDFQEFKDVLQLGAKMDRLIFQGFGLKWTTRKKIMEFLNEHKDLPVFYLD